MKRTLMYFLIICIVHKCYCVSAPNVHNFPETSGIFVHSNEPLLSHQGNSPQQHGMQTLDNSLMKTFQEIILDTLKSLSKVNSKLASYFVQHHPSLTQIYKNMTATSTPLIATTTSSVINLREVNGTQEGPLMMKLSEFVREPSIKENSMSAETVNAGSMSASTVNSKLVQARQIVANNVFVHGNSQNQNFRADAPSFSFRNGNPSPVPNDFGLIIQKTKVYRPTWTNRRNYFPPRQDSSVNSGYYNRRNQFPPRPYASQSNSRRIAQREEDIMQPQLTQVNQRNPYIQRKSNTEYNRFSSISSVSLDSNREKPAISETSKTVQTVVKTPTKNEAKKILSNSRLWYDEWSDSDDLSDEYYDDDYDERLKETDKQFVVSGGDIAAESINAKRVFAGTVKASAIDVPRIIAKDVVVSAKYKGKR